MITKAKTKSLPAPRRVAIFDVDGTIFRSSVLIVELGRKGYYLLAISQSPKTVLDFICKRYCFDKVYGRIFELGPQNKFTGNILDLHLIANKANVVKRAVEKENLTLKGSTNTPSA